MMIVRASISMLMIICTSLLLFPQTLPTAQMNDQTRIAFRSLRNGQHDIFLMNADGSAMRQLTATGDRKIEMFWSPDGTQILYTVHDGDLDLHIVDVETGEITILTDDDAWNDFGAWQPDSEMIFLTIHDDPILYEMHIASAEISPAFSGEVAGRVLSYAPDHSQLLLMVADQLAVTKTDGTGLQTITASPLTIIQAVWTPNGQQIVYWAQDQPEQLSDMHEKSERFAEIHLLDIATLEDTRIMEIAYREFCGDSDLSPDGVSLLFMCDYEDEATAAEIHDTNTDIYVINLETGDLKRLTDSPEHDWQARWSPDGRQILFTSERNNINQIYLMNADGSQQTPLTSEEYSNFSPIWEPIVQE